MAQFDQNDFTARQQTKTTRPGKPKTFNCPNCGGSITVHAVGLAITAVCSYCSSVIDIANENLNILKVAHERTRTTLLTIGSKGALAGKFWEIIGYMQKSDGSEVYRWDEYLLYNPYYGFRFLVQSQGHWSLFKVVKKSLASGVGSNIAKLNGKTYKLFQKGNTKVQYVKGEFYWRVKSGEESYVYDYIAPPYMLSVTKNNDELNIAVGQYIEAKTIEKAFVLSSALPYQSGVGANQPGRYHLDYIGKVWFVAIVAFLLATVIQFGSVLTADNTTVYEEHIEITPETSNKTYAGLDFSVPESGNMMLESYASLSNHWMELDVSLVDENDNTVWENKQALEYYSGVEDGYYWTEGDSSADSLLSAVPAGHYRLLIDVDSDLFQRRQSVNFNVKLKRDVSSWSNYAWTLLLLLVYPAYVGLRYHLFESARWSESDFYGKD